MNGEGEVIIVPGDTGKDPGNNKETKNTDSTDPTSKPTSAPSSNKGGDEPIELPFVPVQ